MHAPATHRDSDLPMWCVSIIYGTKTLLSRQRGGIEPLVYLYTPGVEVQSGHQPDSPWLIVLKT